MPIQCKLLGQSEAIVPPGGSRLQNITLAKEARGQPLFLEVFLLAAWSIWKERNNKHFRGIAPSKNSWLVRFKTDFSLLTYRAKEKHKHLITPLLASIC